MLYAHTQSQFIDAAAAMTRSCIIASANIWTASACRGLSQWTEWIGAGAQPLGFGQAAFGSMPWSLIDWAAAGRSSTAPWNGWLQVMVSPRQSPSADRPASPKGDASPERAGYSSYRSAGGHAAAQVIVPAEELAELTATTILSPMHAILGAWRLALRA